MIEKTLSRLFPSTRNGFQYSALMKRTFDIVISVAMMVLLSPFFLLIALAIKRDSPGPVIYRGKRMGRDGRIFEILKFRTMYEAPESYSGPRVTAHDDPRITPLGRWLRATKLNELPQFWNVLKGDMSLVGPRPEDPTIAQGWPRAVQTEILSVRPGITSPASVHYRNEEALLDSENVFQQYIRELAPDKIRLDQLYVQRRSFYLDLDTLLWTVLILLPKIRSHEPPEGLLFVGPITRFIYRWVNWFAADALIALVAISSAGLMWRSSGPLNLGGGKFIAAALAFALLFSITGTMLGNNRIAWSKAAPDDVYALCAAWAVAALLASVADLQLRVLPLGLVTTASFLALCGFVGLRYRSRLITGLVSRIVHRHSRKRGVQERVLIVGTGQDAQYAAWILDRPGNAHRFQVFGFIDDDLFAQGMRVHGADIVGTCNDIPRLVAEHDVRVIILADHGSSHDHRRSIAEVCRATKTRLVLMPNMVASLNHMCSGKPSACRTGGKTGEDTDPDCLECLIRRNEAQGVTN